MTVTGPDLKLQVRDYDEVLEPYTQLVQVVQAGLGVRRRERSQPNRAAFCAAPEIRRRRVLGVLLK